MSNTYGISKQDEQEIRARDKTCVYCGILMTQYPNSRVACGATIEHFNNDGPFDKKYNVAICCRGCNSSKGILSLAAWFKTPYCCEKKINEETVSKPVKEYISDWLKPPRQENVDETIGQTQESFDFS